MNKAGNKTRYSDKNGRKICYGDFIHVEEYPDRYVGGSLDYEGLVEWDDVAKKTIVTYWDIGFIESTPLRMFPIKGREIKRRPQEALDAPCTIEAKDICTEGAIMLLKALWKSLEKDYYLCPGKRAGIEEYIMSPDFGKLYFFIEPEYVINMLREKYNK